MLAKSLYFGDGFDYAAARSLASELEKSMFFEAGHSLTLRNRQDGSERAISSCSELEVVINEEVKRADADPAVVSRYIVADEKLGNAQAIKKFKSLLDADHEIAAAMCDPRAVKLSYLAYAVSGHREEIAEYLKHDEEYRQRMEEFREKVSEEKSDWDVAVRLFLDRFHLPVKPYIMNRSDVVLGATEPIIGFQFEGAPVDSKTVLENLSDGERKAMYLLSVIFEVERSKRIDGAKLYVFDDIVDSFDYANKYAFVEYLRDFVSDEDTYTILLTHNYDFYRTVASRLSDAFKRDNCLIAEKNAAGCIELGRAEYIRKSPLSAWKTKMDTDAKRIASIAMVRELINLHGTSNGEDYARLSSILHGRMDAASIKFSDLSACYEREIGCKALAGDYRLVGATIKKACEQIASSWRSLDLAEKITISIGVRVEVERYIRGCFETNHIDEGKTPTLGKLARQFKNELPQEYSKHSDCIERAVLIAPENIHINGFMYEPLVDTGSLDFIELYRSCLELK